MELEAIFKYCNRAKFGADMVYENAILTFHYQY